MTPNWSRGRPQPEGSTAMTPQQAFALASEIAQQSTCTRSHVGAVLLDMFGNYLGMGYNQGAECAALCPRGQYTHEQLASTAAYVGPGRCISTHAEMQAIDEAFRSGTLTKEFQGAMLYSTHQPCGTCQPALENLGISCMWLGMTS